MATELEKLVVKLEADISGFRAELKQSQHATQESSKRIEKSLSEMSDKSAKSMGNLGRVIDTALGVSLANLATGAIAKATNALKGLWGFAVTGGVEAAKVQEDAINKLNTALATSGSYSREASKDFQDWADSIQAGTTASSATALELASLAKSYGYSNEQAKRATEAALELSHAAGISATEALRRIGRAAHGSTQDLARFVPEIRSMTKEQLAAGAAADLIIKSFGGSAAGAVKTYSGAKAQLANTASDLQVKLGSLITSNNALLSIMPEVNKIVQGFTSRIGESSGYLKEMVAKGLIIAIEAVNVFVVSLDALGRIATAVFRTIEGAVQRSAQLFKMAGQALTLNFSGALETLKETRQGIIDTGLEIDKAFTEDTALGKLSEQLSNVKFAAQKGMQAIEDGADAATEPVNNVSRGIASISPEMQKAMAEAKKFASDIMQRTMTELELQQLKYEQEKTMLDEHLNNKLISEQTYKEAILALNEDHSNKMQEIRDKELAAERALQIAKVNAIADGFATAVNLSSIFGKKAFAINKRASQAEAMVRGIVAVQNALSTQPFFPVGLAMAAKAGSMALANVARIEATQLQTGIDSVPGIGSKDNFPALLAPGERVVPRETNKDLKEYLSAQDKGGASAPVINVNISGDYFHTDESARTIFDMLQGFMDRRDLRFRGAT